MNSKLRKLAMLSLITLAALAQTAGAEVLWDQSDFDPMGAGFFNSESGSPPFGLTMFSVCDITVDSEWTVDSITQYYSALDPAWGDAIFEGYLHVFAKTGPLPVDDVDDPTTSPLVSMTGVFDTDHIVVMASGLDLTLAAGEYWIGITPIAPGGVMGPELHLASATLIGDATASYDPYSSPNPPAWMNFTPDTDAALTIEGDLVVATDEMTWGGVKSLYR
jgi:hypothetical protein